MEELENELDAALISPEDAAEIINCVKISRIDLPLLVALFKRKDVRDYLVLANAYGGVFSHEEDVVIKAAKLAGYRLRMQPLHRVDNISCFASWEEL
jgi:hypothetical protein